MASSNWDVLLAQNTHRFQRFDIYKEGETSHFFSFLNMVTRECTITYVDHILFLLDSTELKH